MEINVSAINTYFSPEELLFINKRAKDFQSLTAMYDKYPLTDLFNEFIAIGNLRIKTKRAKLTYLAAYQSLLNHRELRFPESIIDQACLEAVKRGETSIDVTNISLESNLSSETIQDMSEQIKAEVERSKNDSKSEHEGHIGNIDELDKKNIEVNATQEIKNDSVGEVKKSGFLSRLKKKKDEESSKTLEEIKDTPSIVEQEKDNKSEDNEESKNLEITIETEDTSDEATADVDIRNKDLLFKWSKIVEISKSIADEAQKYADQKMSEYTVGETSEGVYIIDKKKAVRDPKDPNIEHGMYL